MLTKKIVLIFSITILLLFIIAYFNKSYLQHKLLMSLPTQYKIALQIIASPKRVNHFKNDYNVSFLPDTQYINLNYQQLDLGYAASQNLISSYSDTGKQISYKIDIFEDSVYSVDSNGNIRVGAASGSLPSNQSGSFNGASDGTSKTAPIAFYENISNTNTQGIAVGATAGKNA